MKRLYAFIIAVLVITALPLAVSAETLGEGSGRVFDYAGLMSENEISELESLISGLRTKYGMDLIVLTSNDASTGGSQAYADDFYDYNGFGTGTGRDGFLFFIDMNNRIQTISTSGIMIRYVNDERLSDMYDTAGNYLTDGEYGSAAYMTLNQLDGFIHDGIPSGQYNINENGNIDYYRETIHMLTFNEFFIALLIGLFCALIFCLFIKHRYGLKGSKYKYNLSVNTTVNITGATDVYLRTSVVKTRKQTSSGGGSGSSTHTSSSGSSHGGGSGRSF
jgi:uncharacterized protein